MAFLTGVRSFGLKSLDSINVLLCPHEKFTRPAEVVDSHSLADKNMIAHANVIGSCLHGPLYWHENPNALGDMAMWHGYWAGTCFLSKDIEDSKKAYQGLHMLQYLGNGRICRGAGTAGDFRKDDNAKYYFNEMNGADYTFIQNCSESSLTGFLFAWWAYIMSYGQSGPLWPDIKFDIINLADQIIEDGYCLRDVEGTVAKFGSLKPSMFTAPQRAACGAALFLLADTVAPESGRFGDAYNLYWKRCKGSLLYPEQHFLSWDTPTDDFLAYTYLTIFSTLGVGEQRQKFRDAMRHQIKKNQHQGNPFFNFMHSIALGQSDKYLIETAKKTMSEFNMSVPSLPNAKSPAQVDLTNDPTIPKMGPNWRTGNKILAKQPVPVYRRVPADILMQRNPYRLKGGESNTYNFGEYRLAYQLGKFCGALQ